MEYTALRDKISIDPEFIKSVEEVIKLDVQRSFNNFKSIQAQVTYCLVIYFNEELWCRE